MGAVTLENLYQPIGSNTQHCRSESPDDGRRYCIDIARKGPLVHPLSDNLTYIQYLELVRRGEEDDRIARLPEAERIAAQAIEDERRAMWDREFADMQENNRSTMMVAESHAEGDSLEQPPITQSPTPMMITDSHAEEGSLEQPPIASSPAPRGFRRLLAFF